MPEPQPAADMAQVFLHTADQLGGAIVTIEAALRDVRGPLADESRAADTVLIDGPEVIAALRTLAMRCDRGAYLSRMERGE